MEEIKSCIITALITFIITTIVVVGAIAKNDNTPTIGMDNCTEKQPLDNRVYQLEKNWESMLNYFCLNIQHYTGAYDYQVMEKWPYPDAGRCQPGFKTILKND